ncbi:MAG: dynamin family protein [Pseudomonadota bacterium]
MSEQGMGDNDMNYAAPAVVEPQTDEEKRPRVALMGEFSAGKSTLSNLLVGRSALPVNITATQLPPVWMSYGHQPAFKVGLDGAEQEVDASFDGVSVHDTRCVRVFLESNFLKNCDLIDMPGISDPNMAAEVWQRVIGEADIVLWCSHATQAWRQSEAAVWGTMPHDLYDKSLLLLTRMDRILADRDRVRVVKRVQSETEGLFREVLPVSLTQALEAKDDPEAWTASGADHLVKSLMALTDEVATGAIGRRVSRKINPESARKPSRTLDDAIGERVVERPARIVMPTRVRPRPLVSRPPARP